MCGIWFSLGFPPDPARIDLVSHRGPDGRGWQAFEFVPAEMKAMQMRGCQEAAAVLGAAVDCSGF